MKVKRGSGILMHITSLPSPYGVGDLGPEAYRFADILAGAKQKFWQLLPVNPTIHVCGDSPYSSTSAFAGNVNLISPEILSQEGLLSEEDVNARPGFDDNKCNFLASSAYKEKLFSSLHKRLKVDKDLNAAYKGFCLRNAGWLEDYAYFEVIRERYNGEVWSKWDKKLKGRKAGALKSVKKEEKDRIENIKFLQYIFFRQWFSLKNYCNQRNILLIGDVPIYVNYDSADVWSHTGIFKLNEDKSPTFVSGVPPDCFSETGQLWGNPVYRWDVIKESGFEWWIKRMEHNLSLFDIVRIDHFRGLVSYWEVASTETTAVNGNWINAPAVDFFTALLQRFPDMPIIAEDLGIITDDVRKVLADFKFPGMKILLFAFGEDHPMHPYLPHTFKNNWVVYTGTHDNNTVKGWFEKQASDDEKRRLYRYIGREVSVDNVSQEVMRLSMRSVANMAIIPLQDVLGLGEEARMNIPSTVNGNWQWRIAPGHIVDEKMRILQEMTEIYGRAI